MGETQVKQKHPKGFYSCCITFTFERLAFYVAMTRAKEHLCLSAVRSRYDKETEPSRFLGEMGLDAASIFQKKIKKS